MVSWVFLFFTTIIYTMKLSLLPIAALATKSHEDFDTRAAYVDHLNNLPAMTWTAGVNERFANLPLGAAASLCGVKEHSHQELLSLVKQGVVQSGVPPMYADIDPPASFDSATNWPECADIIGDIRDQSDCGCCWAFGAAEAASDRLCIATNGTIKVPLSAQETCFCAESNGCNGGTLYTPWQYIQSNGIVTGGQFNNTGPLQDFCSDFSLPHCHHHGPQGSDPFPAEGTPGCPKVSESPSCPTKCDDPSSNRRFETDKYGFDGTVYLYGHTVKTIQTAIYQHGPVEAAFTVFADFENYVSGIYQHVSGGQLGGHAIRIVGWGTENGTDYWKVANSWNPYWGEKGYFRIVRGAPDSKGCGIEQSVTANGPKATWGKK